MPARRKKIEAPKPRNPVAATMRDPSNGMTGRVIPKRREEKLPRKRKHKGKISDE